MESLEKSSGSKSAPQSDFRGGASRDCELQTKKPMKMKKKVPPARFATRNVNTLLQNSKLENLNIEMRKMNIDVLAIGEMRWPDGGDFWSDEYRIIHSDTYKPGHGGVGIVLKKDLGKRVKGYVDRRRRRILLVKLDTQPVNTTIIQVYICRHQIIPIMK